MSLSISSSPSRARIHFHHPSNGSVGLPRRHGLVSQDGEHSPGASLVPGLDRFHSVVCTSGQLSDPTSNSICACRIVYRVSLVFQTPVEELEEILGIDIPPVPDIALSSITSNSVLLYWKSHENYHSPLRNVIQINGINGTECHLFLTEMGANMSSEVGEFDRSDNSVQLTGLTPGNYYGIRAIATNATGNSSYSRFIQVQTIPLDGHRGEKILANLDPAHGLRGRRISDAESSEESTSESSEEDNDDSEEEESVSKLTKKLDSLRRQKDEADRELSEEVGEADGLKATLTKERDELKRAVEEKDKNSQDFRKQVNELEKQSKAAQRKKSAKERTLQQKKAERQKTKDDIARWEQESIDMENETETMRGEIDDLEDAHSKRVAETQKLIESAQADSRTLEEEIREWGTKIKALEEERQKAHQDQNEEEKEAERREKEADQTHESRVQMLQAEYATLWKYTNQVRFIYVALLILTTNAL